MLVLLTYLYYYGVGLDLRSNRSDLQVSVLTGFRNSTVCMHWTAGKQNKKNKASKKSGLQAKLLYYVLKSTITLILV